jgi:hypothetical protein
MLQLDTVNNPSRCGAAQKFTAAAARGVASVRVNE